MMQLDLPFRYPPKSKLNPKDYQEAAHRVFDSYPGIKFISMDSLCSLIAGKLKIEPSSYIQVYGEIKEAILASTQFTLTRGRGGGVSRGLQFQPCGKLQEACSHPSGT